MLKKFIKTTFAVSVQLGCKNQFFGLLPYGCVFFFVPLHAENNMQADILLKKLKYYSKMKKTFKIEVDCANCANLVETAVRKVAGVKDASISFMTQKMKIEFDEGADADSVMAEVEKTAKKIESDFEILK